MKKLEELGISPAPWVTALNAEGEYAVDVVSPDYTDVANCVNASDARLIAAAPELYKWLAYAVEYYKCETRSCDNCPNGKCWIVDATAALAKASGESEVRHDA